MQFAEMHKTCGSNYTSRLTGLVNEIENIRMQ